jgi:hypothetical protein
MWQQVRRKCNRDGMALADANIRMPEDLMVEIKKRAEANSAARKSLCRTQSRAIFD